MTMAISNPPCPLGPEYLADLPEEQPISRMNNSYDLAEYPEDGMTTLLPCISCNRTFNPVALERHRKVCEKLSSKRSVFDSTKKRINDIESPRGSPSRDAAPPKLKSRWREKRAEFLRAIRAAKNTSDDSDDDCGRRNSVPSDYEQCPFCTRYFGPKAADRHIDWCREQRNRLPKSVTQEENNAIARMKTRTKYMPPRPGHSGWRAPKKKDVISSIPPQNSGPNVTPAGRLVTPPLPNYRQISPPPMSPSRKASSSSLPPGPPRYGTSSLGRSAGKQFAAMLQSVTGSPSGYGLSSGYGSSSLYGSPSPASSGYSNTPFQRTSSLRIPRKKYGNGQKMARHRDLASDMLASVMGGGGKRGEPEGHEAGSHKYFEKNSYRLEDKPYDPFSAAELQFQSLLAPSKSQICKSSGMMGSTGSLKHVGLGNSSPEHDYRFRNYSKPRSTSLGAGHHTLSLLGLNSYGIPVSTIAYSEKDSAENSPIDSESPEDNLDILSRLSSSKSPHFSPNRSPYRLSPTRSPSRCIPNRSSPIRINSMQREKSPYKQSIRPQIVEPFNDLIISLEETAGSRKPADGANLYKSLPLTEKKYSKKKSLENYNSSINQGLDNKSHEYNGNSANYGWIDTPSFDDAKNFSRHFGRDNMKDRTSADGMHSSIPSSVYDSLKAIRDSFPDDPKKKDYTRLDDNQQRISSGSSTDSSFPPVSSPMSSSSPHEKNHAMSQIMRFCHECGQKYPVDLAKFCCQCGARRIHA